jgi:hypothetical protein
MVVNLSSILIWIVVEEGTLDTPAEASGTHSPCVGTMFLGGTIRVGVSYARTELTFCKRIELPL